MLEHSLEDSPTLNYNNLEQEKSVTQGNPSHDILRAKKHMPKRLELLHGFEEHASHVFHAS